MEEKVLTRKFLIATHGSFAKGIKSSLDIIIGQIENLFLIQAYLGENKSIEEELHKVMRNIGPDDELIVFTDLMGGSITNQILRFALREHVHIVAGFNLPLLMEILLGDTETPVVELIENAIQNAKDQIVYVNTMLTAGKGEDNDD